MKKTAITLAALALLSAPALATQVLSDHGTTNLTSTDWNATDCNGTQTVLQCTLNGSDATGEGADRGDEGGKH